MFRRPTVVVFLFAICSLAVGCSGGRGGDTPTPEETTLTRVGQTAPDFTLPNLDATEFTLSDARGKVVLINWFATWCPPCQKEMAHLREQVWERFADRDFVMVSIAREEDSDVVAPFAGKYEAEWPFLLDVERKAYSHYAEAYIPRNHVVDRDGKIIFQSEGFEQADFDKMIEAINTALATP